MSLYKKSGKRILDLAIAAVLLTLLWPVMLAVAVLIRMKLGTPVIFRQERPGLNGRPFVLYKFRSMTDARRPGEAELPDSVRMTELGRWLRKTSLDELPQLWNVLKGDMSLVGPRPLLMEYLPLYDADEMRRHEVRPGVTGWTQVKGRNALTWDEKFALDVWYVDHRSPRLDVEILAKTVSQVFSGHGVSAPGHATMENFRGQENTTP